MISAKRGATQWSLSTGEAGGAVMLKEVPGLLKLGGRFPYE